ncbi:MAG: hypothetical protein Q9225_002445 [Loekoesia sp. 1 TL-2023]
MKAPLTDLSSLHQALLTVSENSGTTKAHLIILFCGIAATALAAGSCAALFGRVLYHRLKARSGQAHVNDFRGLEIFKRMFAPKSRVRQVTWGEHIRDDVEMQDPFVVDNAAKGDTHAGYSEVKEEGLGIHFVDIDLEDGRANSGSGWWRR